MGIIFFIILGWPFALIAMGIDIAVLIPSLIFTLYNLKTCIKEKWPIKNAIGFGVCCTIFIIAAAAIIYMIVQTCVYIGDAIRRSESRRHSSLSSNQAELLFNTLKYWLISKF